MSGESEEWDDGSEESVDEQDSLCTILAEEKLRYHDRELQTDPSSGTYNLEHHDVYGGDELEKIAVSKKTIQGDILQFKHQDESRTRGRQGGIEKDSLCEA